jgi:predicted aspartyl protease
MSAPLLACMLAAGVTLAIGQQPLVAPDAALPPLPGTEISVPANADHLERMTVGVFINGQGPFQFVVDTGANRTVLSRALAARLALPAGERIRLHDITGISQAETARVESLKVGTREVRDLVAPLLSATDMGADGILGIDGLIGQQIVMDFLEERMTITPVRTGPGTNDMIVVKARSRFGQLILADAKVGRERVFVIVDSGAQYSVGNSVLRSRLLRTKRGGIGIPIELVGVSGRTAAADLVVTPEMKIGEITVQNVPIAFSDVHPFRQFGLHDKPAMLLGMDLLRSFAKVSLDFEQKKVRFRIKE